MSQTRITRGKIVKPLDPDIVRYINEPTALKDYADSREALLQINLAHVLMLARQGILTQDVAKAIVRETLKFMDETHQPAFKFETQIEDLYSHLEHLLIDRLGIDVGGQQHTARSRNDMSATLSRMACRKSWLRLAPHFLRLRNTLLELAKNSTDCVFSGYTHLQPSEPITFSHWLCALLFALERNYDDFSSVWGTINQNPLGACSMGSTTFPINREFTSELLGFDGPIDNALDAVSSRDYAQRLVFAMTECANTLSRMATDLYVWATPQFGYVEVDDSCAVCSSIMPQKKNAFTLEHIKAKAAHLHGHLMGILSCTRSTPYSHCKDVSVEATKYLADSVLETEGILVLANTTLRSMTLNRDKMLKDARSNFSTVTELANALVQIDGISFREAHGIVANVVRALTDNHLSCLDIHEPIVQEFFQSSCSRRSKIDEPRIQEALDPTRIAMAKRACGGCAPEEVSRQIDKLEKKISLDEQEIQSRITQLTQAETNLKQAVAVFIERH